MLPGVPGVVVFLRATPATSRGLVGEAPSEMVCVSVGVGTKATRVRSTTPDTGPEGVVGTKTMTVGGADGPLGAVDKKQNTAPLASINNAIATIQTLRSRFKATPYDVTGL